LRPLFLYIFYLHILFFCFHYALYFFFVILLFTSILGIYTYIHTYVRTYVRTHVKEKVNITHTSCPSVHRNEVHVCPSRNWTPYIIDIFWEPDRNKSLNINIDCMTTWDRLVCLALNEILNVYPVNYTANRTMIQTKFIDATQVILWDLYISCWKFIFAHFLRFIWKYNRFIYIRTYVNVFPFCLKCKITTWLKRSTLSTMCWYKMKYHT